MWVNSQGYTSQRILLNFDILVEVMAWQAENWDRGSISRLMRTCRTLYTAGISYVMLTKPEIELSSHRTLESLYTFLLRDPENRFRYLRRLILNVPWRNRNGQTTIPAKDMLPYIFENASHLEKLRLSDSDILELDKRIPRSISGLKSLEHFSAIIASKTVLKILRRIKSPLARLQLSFDCTDFDQLNDPIEICASAKDTLEELRCSWAYFQKKEPVYPRLKKLYVEHNHLVALEPLLRCYPNLQHLHVFTHREVYDLGDQDDWDALHMERSENQVTQKGGSWSSLASLGGTIVYLFILGLQLKVGRLLVETSPNTDEEAQMLLSVVSDTRPSSIEFEFDLAESSFDFLETHTLLAPARGELNSLYLHLKHSSDTWADVDSLMVRLAVYIFCLGHGSIHFSRRWNFCRHYLTFALKS